MNKQRMRINLINFLIYSLLLPIVLILFIFTSDSDAPISTLLSDLGLFLIFFIPIITSYYLYRSLSKTFLCLGLIFLETIICGFIHLATTGAYWGKENWYFDGYIWLILITIVIALIYNPIATSIIFYVLKQKRGREVE